MAKNQKKYTAEFKQQMVDLYNSGIKSFPQLEREYGVARSSMSTWVKQLSPIKVSEEETITLKEYKALHKKMRDVEIENEILKKRPTYSRKINSRESCFCKPLQAFIYNMADMPCHQVSLKHVL